MPKNNHLNQLPRFDFGQMVARLRQHLEQFTCKEIGRRTGYHPEYVRRYLRKDSPRTDFIISVVQSFEIDSRWLLLGPESESESDDGSARNSNTSTFRNHP